MKNTEETIFTPSEVFTNSRAGRIVLAVVCAAPETMPSTSPICTIMVPK